MFWCRDIADQFGARSAPTTILTKGDQHEVSLAIFVGLVSVLAMIGLVRLLTLGLHRPTFCIRASRCSTISHEKIRVNMSSYAYFE